MNVNIKSGQKKYKLATGNLPGTFGPFLSLQNRKLKKDPLARGSPPRFARHRRHFTVAKLILAPAPIRWPRSRTNHRKRATPGRNLSRNAWGEGPGAPTPTRGPGPRPSARARARAKYPAIIDQIVFQFRLQFWRSQEPPNLCVLRYGERYTWYS